MADETTEVCADCSEELDLHCDDCGECNCNGDCSDEEDEETEEAEK